MLSFHFCLVLFSKTCNTHSSENAILIFITGKTKHWSIKPLSQVSRTTLESYKCPTTNQ